MRLLTKEHYRKNPPIFFGSTFDVDKVTWATIWSKELARAEFAARKLRGETQLAEIGQLAESIRADAEVGCASRHPTNPTLVSGNHADGSAGKWIADANGHKVFRSSKCGFLEAIDEAMESLQPKTLSVSTGADAKIVPFKAADNGQKPASHGLICMDGNGERKEMTS